MVKRIFRTGIPGILIALCMIIQIRVTLTPKKTSYSNNDIVQIEITNDSIMKIEMEPVYKVYRYENGDLTKVEFGTYASFPYYPKEVEPGESKVFTLSLRSLLDVTPGTYKVVREFKLYGVIHSVYTDIVVE